jgi:hypothetical protein
MLDYILSLYSTIEVLYKFSSFNLELTFFIGINLLSQV